MTEQDPTNEELLKKIEVLEGEVDELQGKIDRLLKIEKACYSLAERLAEKHGESLSDWWWLL